MVVFDDLNAPESHDGAAIGLPNAGLSWISPQPGRRLRMPTTSQHEPPVESAYPCPACGYDLGGLLAVASRPRTRCPECGLISSKWLIERRRNQPSPAGRFWWMLAIAPAILGFMIVLIVSHSGALDVYVSATYLLFVMLCSALSIVSATFRFRHISPWRKRFAASFGLACLLVMINVLSCIILWALSIPIARHYGW